MRFLDIEISADDGRRDALSYYPSKLVNWPWVPEVRYRVVEQTQLHLVGRSAFLDLGAVTEYMAVDMAMLEEL